MLHGIQRFKFVPQEEKGLSDGATLASLGRWQAELLFPTREGQSDGHEAWLRQRSGAPVKSVDLFILKSKESVDAVSAPVRIE